MNDDFLDTLILDPIDEPEDGVTDPEDEDPEE